MRFTSIELKLALKGRFLRKLNEWVADMPSEGLKAASRDVVGAGDFALFYHDQKENLTPRTKPMKKRRNTPRLAQDEAGEKEGVGDVIMRSLEVILGLCPEKKTKKAVVQYIKDCFTPALEEKRNIWEIRYTIPNVNKCVESPYPKSAITTKYSPCLKQKFPGLCSLLEVATPIKSRRDDMRPVENCSTPLGQLRSELCIRPRPANISENSRGGKVRTQCPEEVLRKKKPSHSPGFLTYDCLMQGWSPAEESRKRKRSTCTMSQIYRKPSTWTQPLTDNSISDCQCCGYDEELVVEAPTTSKYDEPVTKKIKCENTHVVEADTLQKALPVSKEVVPISRTPQFWPPHPHSAGQETVRSSSASGPPPSQQTIVATTHPVISIVRAQDSLPSPNLAFFVKPPKSYLQHRIERLEAKVRLERERAGALLGDGVDQAGIVTENDGTGIQGNTLQPGENPSHHLPPSTALSRTDSMPLPPMDHQSPITAMFISHHKAQHSIKSGKKKDSPLPKPPQNRLLDCLELVSPGWCEPLTFTPDNAEKIVELSSDGVVTVEVVETYNAGRTFVRLRAHANSGSSSDPVVVDSPLVEGGSTSSDSVSPPPPYSASLAQ